MKSILSIESHVAYGYVGNRAAVFPLQRLGFDVTAINTVQFSNHTGYGDWEGEIFSPEQIQNLIDGVRKRQLFPKLSALLTGYLGNPELGDVLCKLVNELKTANPSFIYCCDPVMGDTDGGCYVRPGISETFKHKLMPLADILTPNLFELSFLSDHPIETLEDIQKACDILLQKGPNTILVTSVICKQTPANTIQMLLHRKDGSWLVDMPLLHLETPPNGAGDVTASVLLAHTLNDLPPKEVLAKTAESIFGIYEATAKAGTRELQLIAAQDELVAPSHHFEVVKI